MCDHAPNREAAMTVLARDASGVPTVWCDPCLAPLIEALNAGGLPTVASCCGHGQRPGVVTLADGRVLLVAEDQGLADRMMGAFPDINGLTLHAALAAKDAEAERLRAALKSAIDIVDAADDVDILALDALDAMLAALADGEATG